MLKMLRVELILLACLRLDDSAETHRYGIKRDFLLTGIRGMRTLRNVRGGKRADGVTNKYHEAGSCR